MTRIYIKQRNESHEFLFYRVIYDRTFFQFVKFADIFLTAAEPHEEKTIMTLKETIDAQIKQAMLKRETVRLGTLRMVKAKLLEKEVEKRPTGGMTAADELQVLTSAAKMRKESIEEFEKAGRKDLADKERAELEIIQEYLPKQLSREEVVKTIDELAAQLGAKTQSDFGKLMSATMKELRGKADGKMVQEVVKARLG